MASLNIDKAIEKGRKLIGGSGYDLPCSQILKFYEYDDDWDKICNAFYFGVCQGAKVARRQMKDRQMKGVKAYEA